MSEELKQAAQQACHCQTCHPITMDDMRMVLCPTCGNKRCPHANDHRNACTNSNDPGQPGSAYPASTLTQRPAAQAGEVELAFDQGWRMAAEWANRDDLIPDMDSPHYAKERSDRLASLPTQPAKQSMEVTDCMVNAALSAAGFFSTAESRKDMHSALMAALVAQPAAQATGEPVGYMNEGHIHELAMGRLPYGYVYPEAGAGASTAVYTHPAPGVPPTKDQIRDVFLANGFTIKDGQADLKPYVYAAADALLKLVSPAPGVPEGFALVPMTKAQVRAACKLALVSTPRSAEAWIETGIRFAEEHHTDALAAAQAKGADK